jgi:hypothetical protein
VKVTTKRRSSNRDGLRLEGGKITLHRDASTTLAFEVDVDDPGGRDDLDLQSVARPSQQIEPLNPNRIVFLERTRPLAHS